VIDKASGEWLGRIGPWFPEDWPGTEVGWGLKRSAWGRGYAVEAATAAMDFAFDRLGWDEAITPSCRTTRRPRRWPSGSARGC